MKRMSSGLLTKLLKRLALPVLVTLIVLAASGDVISSPASADTASTPGKVTGGGQISGDPIFSPLSDLLSPPALIPSLADPKSQASLGFVVSFQSGNAVPTGNLHYDDPSADVRIKAPSYTSLVISGSTSCPSTAPQSLHARFSGTASVISSTRTTIENFTVNVDDCGDPGTSDRFGISADGGYNNPSGASLGATSILIGGNIQVHPAIAPIPPGLKNNIQHIVVLMQENRSFDHYFGQLHAFDPTLDVEAEPADASNPDPTNLSGPPIRAFHRSENLPADWAKFCEVHDLDHSWNGTHLEWDNGNMDGFTKQNVFNNPIPGGPSDPKGSRAMGFYNQTDLPFYYGLYDTFAMGDRYFASVLSQTFPNRFYLLAGTSFVSDPNGSNQFAETGNRTPGANAPATEFKGRSIFNLLDEANPPISWKVYNAEPVLAFANEFAYVRSHPEKVVPIGDYFADAQAGTLPQVAFVDPIFVGPKNVENDEHPPANIQVGQDFVARAISALMASPNWSSSAFFLTYDEHGGYFDHVAPPAAVPPDSHQPPPGLLPPAFDQYGVRVPAVVVSPFSKKHFVSHVVHDHTSILRFIETRFGLSNLTQRDLSADPMLEFFDFKDPPFVIPPALPAATIDSTGLVQCQLLETTTPPSTP